MGGGLEGSARVCSSVVRSIHDSTRTTPLASGLVTPVHRCSGTHTPMEQEQDNYDSRLFVERARDTLCRELLSPTDKRSGFHPAVCSENGPRVATSTECGGPAPFMRPVRGTGLEAYEACERKAE